MVKKGMKDFLLGHSSLYGTCRIVYVSDELCELVVYNLFILEDIINNGGVSAHTTAISITQSRCTWKFPACLSLLTVALSYYE